MRTMWYALAASTCPLSLTTCRRIDEDRRTPATNFLAGIVPALLVPPKVHRYPPAMLIYLPGSTTWDYDEPYPDELDSKIWMPTRPLQRADQQPLWTDPLACLPPLPGHGGERVNRQGTCAFATPGFNPPVGLAAVTTPRRFLELARSRLNRTASAAAAGSTASPYRATAIPGKGIGLIATRPIRAGERVMAEPVTVLVDGQAWGQEGWEGLLAAAVEGLGEKMAGEVRGLAMPDGWTGGVEEGVVRGNAFKISGKTGGEMGWHGVFLGVSRLNHACAPNMGYHFDRDSMEMRVYAAQDVWPGEELTISYVDLIQDSHTRQESLSATWGFTCTCQRCTRESHVLAESDSRVQQILDLWREVDDYGGGKGTPEKAELLVTLYELEGLQARIHEAYYRAALEWNGDGDQTRAVRYARLGLDRGLLMKGEDKPFVQSLREMVKDPKDHWSWRFRVDGKEKL